MRRSSAEVDERGSAQYEPEPHPDAMIDSPMQSQYFKSQPASPIGKFQKKAFKLESSPAKQQEECNIKEMGTQINFEDEDSGYY